MLNCFTFIHSLPEFNLLLICAFTWLTLPWHYRTMTCRERELTMDHIHTFLTTQGHGGPPLITDQLSVGTVSKTKRTWMTIHTIHAPIHSNKVNKKGWLLSPNDIRGPWGPKASWHLSYRWGKTSKKPHAGNLSRPGIAAWQVPGHATACSTGWTTALLKNINMNVIHSWCPWMVHDRRPPDVFPSLGNILVPLALIDRVTSESIGKRVNCRAVAWKRLA